MVKNIGKVCSKLVALMSVAIFLTCFVVSDAWADDLYEWNRSCRRKTICETKVYSGGDTNRVKATIPANTYVKVHGGGTEEWIEVSYKTASGQSGIGLVHPECVGYAVVWFTDANGDRRGMQELEYYEKYGNNAAPGATMDEVRPGYSDYTKIDPNGTGESVGTGEAAKPESGGSADNSSRPAATPKPSASTSSNKKPGNQNVSAPKSTEIPANLDVLWQGRKVSVKTWGFHSSVVLVDGEEQIVPTHGLVFSDSVDADKRIAYIHAPRTGRCYLRAKGSDTGDIIDKCPAGTVVQVVEYGKSYCRIVYDGQVGYVQNACLKFADPEIEPLCTWQLSYNGKMTGNAQVPIRNSAENDSSIIVKLRSGTAVTVLSKTGSWYEVEHDGLHGFVHKNFLILED